MVANFVTGLDFQNCSSITIPSGKGNAVIPYKAETVNNSNVINGINTTSGISTSCNLSVEEVITNNPLSFFPNPVKGDDFTINTNSIIQKITIYNMSGEKTKEENGNNSTQQIVNVKDLSTGCYLVKIKLDNGKTNSIKFIKK